MAAARGAIVAAAAAASAAGAANQLDTVSQGAAKVVPPQLHEHLGGEVTASVLTLGGVHTIVGTLLDADDEWIVIRGRNGKHFLIPVPRLLALKVEPSPETSLPRSA